MQLVGAVFPVIARLQQEGDVGRQKINQYTSYLTLVICVVQGLLLLVALSTKLTIAGSQPSVLAIVARV